MVDLDGALAAHGQIVNLFECLRSVEVRMSDAKRIPCVFIRWIAMSAFQTSQRLLRIELVSTCSTLALPRIVVFGMQCELTIGQCL